MLSLCRGSALVFVFNAWRFSHKKHDQMDMPLSRYRVHFTQECVIVLAHQELGRNILHIPHLPQTHSTCRQRESGHSALTIGFH